MCYLLGCIARPWSELPKTWLRTHLPRAVHPHNAKAFAQHKECPICQCPSQDVAPLDRLYEDALRHYQRNLFTECVRICEEVLLVDERQRRPRPFSLNSATMVWGFVMMSRERVCSRSKFTRLHYSARQTSNGAFPNKSTFAAGCLTQDATASNSSVQSINKRP